MTILKMSLMASILIIIITIIRMLAIHKLPKKVFIILWGIVLCRLIIPLSVPSNISVPPAVSNVTNFLTDSRLAETLMFSRLDRMSASIPMNSEKIIEGGYLSSIPPYVLIWLAGSLLVATFFVVTHLRYLREYKTALPIQSSFINDWLSKQTKQIEIRQSDKILSPLTYGIWCPIILLPKAMDYGDTRLLKYVLTHELIHIKRFDTLFKWLLVMALCIHWFNPLVWIMYILANRDIELSCDETVVRTFGESEKTTYARTLISMAESRSKWVPLYSNFSKNSIEERIIAIMKFNKANVLGAVFVTTLVLVTMFATSVDSAKDLKSLSLFEYVNVLDDVSQYPSEMNDIYNDTAIVTTEDYSIYILNTIFTNRNVYVIVRLEGNVAGDPAINGQIVSIDEQIVYELDDRFKEIEQEGESRYFFYTGNIAETVTLNSKKLTKSALLELVVHLNGKEYQLQTEVQNIASDMLIFQPEPGNYDSDYYQTILLTSQGLRMTGSSEKLTDDWIHPNVKITIVRTEGREINVSHDTRGSISDEGILLNSGAGHNSDTGEFSLDWNFRDWELDLSQVAALIIDDVTYHVH